MTVSIEWFGYGVGVVLLGWMGGLIVSYAFSINIGISRMGNKSR